MASVLLLPDAAELRLTGLEFDESTQTITASAVTTASSAKCPLCQQASARIHSHYVRTLADLPCSGQRVRWLVQVRRFRCLNADCERKLFTERLPTCAAAYARRTIREAAMLCELAFALGGRAGAPIVRLLGMPVSHDTLVRLMRRHPPQMAATPRVLGVDDFAWKRGRRYGTILIDQVRHLVVDVLPDRETETLVKWFAEHPGVEIVSRDRAGNYADAVRRGAPQAQQVADRFHLLVNLQTTLARFFERNHDLLKHMSAQARAEAQAPSPLEGTSERSENVVPKPLTATQAQQLARRARRHSRYEEVIKLHEQGMSQVAIATVLGMHRDTVRGYIKAPAFPEIVRPHRHKSKLDPYKPYLHEQWALGQRNATHLIADIRAQGFRGSDTIVFDYLRPLREEAAWREVYEQCKAHKQRGMSVAPMSAHEAAWLFVCNPRKLKLRQVWQLESLRTAEEDLGRAYELAQDFRSMVTLHQPEHLARWLEEAKASGIAAFKGFVAGIYRDYEAVRNGLALEWSQGQTEAQVHRLKLIKRQAYGRANFDLLRLRVLHRSAVPDHQLCV